MHIRKHEDNFVKSVVRKKIIGWFKEFSKSIPNMYNTKSNYIFNLIFFLNFKTTSFSVRKKVSN